MADSWDSSQTLIFILLFASFFSVANCSIQNQVRQIVQDSATLLDQAASTIANATDSLLSAVSGPIIEDQAFLGAHNKARLHAGEPPFVWDSKLASYARQYAQKRSVDCQLIHSDGPYGENIFWGGGNEWQPTDMVALWLKEHRFYDRNTMKCVDGKMCGHYTQVVWRDSLRLGCAKVQCVNGDTFGVCSYDPPGNYIGENPFNHNTRK